MRIWRACADEAPQVAALLGAADDGPAQGENPAALALYRSLRFETGKDLALRRLL